MNIADMSDALDQIQASQCLSDKHREAAKRANELLRAVRATLDISWKTNAADLYAIGCRVRLDDQLDIDDPCDD